MCMCSVNKDAICFNASNVCIWTKLYMHVLHPGLSSCLCLQVDCGYLCVFTESEIKACVCSDGWGKTPKGVKSASPQQLAALIFIRETESSYAAELYRSLNTRLWWDKHRQLSLCITNMRFISTFCSADQSLQRICSSAPASMFTCQASTCVFLFLTGKLFFVFFRWQVNTQKMLSLH